MRPGTRNLSLYAGDTEKFNIAITAGGSPVDLTGWTGKAEIRPTRGSATLIATFTTTISSTPTDGTLVIALSKVQTAALPVGDSIGVWDLQMTAPGGDVKTFLTGSVSVTQDVTDTDG